jgi:Na+-driven multidrug efflux pump
MRSMAAFGSAAVAGQATIDRIAPVAFALLFALSGAIGPILAQNLGAGRPDRVRAALWDAVIFTLLAVLASWAFLALAQDALIRAFSAHGATADLVHLYCSWLAGTFVFAALLFVANAAFNNLGHPLLSTAFNWGRATLGTIPFVTVGAEWGPRGVLIGQALGAVAFGVAAIAVAFHVLPRAKATTPEQHAQAHHALTGLGVLAMLQERRLRSPAG